MLLGPTRPISIGSSSVTGSDSADSPDALTVGGPWPAGPELSWLMVGGPRLPVWADLPPDLPLLTEVCCCLCWLNVVLEGALEECLLWLPLLSPLFFLVSLPSLDLDRRFFLELFDRDFLDDLSPELLVSDLLEVFLVSEVFLVLPELPSVVSATDVRDVCSEDSSPISCIAICCMAICVWKFSPSEVRVSLR